MMCGGAEDGMLGLLECELESWRWQNVRDATEVLDAVAHDRGKTLAVHDFLVQSKGFFTTKHAHVIVGRRELWRLDLRSP